VTGQVRRASAPNEPARHRRCEVDDAQLPASDFDCAFFTTSTTAKHRVAKVSRRLMRHRVVVVAQYGNPQRSLRL